MPDIDGVELIARLHIARLRGVVPDIGIVGLSGGGAHQTPHASLILARQAGADSALAKPVANGELLAAINALFAGRDG